MATRSLSRSCSQLSTSPSTSLARAFLQLAPPRRHFASTTTTPPLDFLFPPSLYQSASKPSPLTQTRRSFASTVTRQQTKAIFNPQQDEDGNDMHVEITPRASNRLKEIMSKDSNPDLALRIQVESGGCHGFQYLMSLTSLPSLSTSTPPTTAPQEEKKEENKALGEDDTVFEAEDGSGARVVMDTPSLELLKGSKIDYTMELIGSQFKIVDNPLATSSCGCGTSFDIKG
ncbi:Iron-sulfur assembly protein [Lachnellula suecica]|uniref:Iron-sulfur assembly protein n=1 Tax=Lachnellula suecica TaxID=602035 RepID=A0A8T9C783_9HELO|nr:Iron-sulfur assembly protein [Lachnellula suecica]